MKHAYPWMRLVLAALFSFIVLSSSAQQAWRPFRPGLIYTYEVPGSTNSGPYTTAGIYTLRLDSAYVTVAGDSVWAFNRVLRETTGQTPGEAYYRRFRKSRNNLFGQRLRWQPGSTEYTLETVAEGSYQSAVSLLLKPQAVVGSTWVASVALGINASLTSRSLQMVNGQADMVAVITLSTGPVIRLSQNSGLIEGPQWLALSGNTRQWVATQLPTTLGRSVHSPLQLFDLQPGDELGYFYDPIILTPLPCSTGHILRQILTRSQTVDSLVYTYREQGRYNNSGAPGCGLPAGTTYTGIGTGRWAFSLRTCRSNQFPEIHLLTGEYWTSSGSTRMSLGGVQLQPGSSGCGGSQRLVYDQLYLYGANDGTLGHIPDLDPQTDFSSVLGLGPVKSINSYLTYFRRTRGGQVTTCGSRSDFASLLPTRAVQAAALATLHPNPAAEAATLTLAQPARPGTILHLTDALGRLVWSAPVSTGQTAISVSLAGQPAGLYLLQLSGTDGTSASWKLVHE